MLLDIGTVRRPALGQRVSGDAFAVVSHPDSLLVAVVDGLGHGPNAAEAADAFVESVEGADDVPLDTMMADAGRRLAHTRGAAATIVRLDFARRRIETSGVGNVHFQAHADRSIHPVSAPGIVGHRVRKVLRFEFGLPDELLFSLSSDGLSSRIHLERYTDGTAQEIAERLLEHYGKAHDDATCIVVRYAAEAPA